MKRIKYFIRYIKETKHYRNKSIIQQIIHNKLLQRANWYAKTMRMTDKMVKQYQKTI